jgi:hypothetical protein
MPTNADAIRDLEDSKKALEDQCAAASGAALLKLLLSIQHIADEVGAVEALMLATAAYVPQTDPFKSVTADAKAFIAALNSIKAAFAALGPLVQAIDKLLTYIK